VILAFLLQSTTAGPLLNVVLGIVAVATCWWAIRTLHRETAARKTLNELRGLSPEAFEKWTAARFRELGFRASLTPAQGDHGVDVVVEKPGWKGVVQCKKYTGAVGEPVLRDLLGTMHAYQANCAYLVTTGRLTGPAQHWVRGKPIEVWDGTYLASTYGRLVGDPQQKEADMPAHLLGGATDELRPTGTSCPRCGSALVMRRNRQSGTEFLGCSRYPACHHTQPAESAVGV
jgi:restriction system protein